VNTIDSCIPRIRHSDKLRLREFTLEDRQAIAAMHQDPRLSVHLLDNVPLDSSIRARQFIKAVEKKQAQQANFGIWAAERLEPGYTDRELIAGNASNYLSEEAIEALRQPRWCFCGWFNLAPVPGQEHLMELGARLMPHVWGSRLSLLGGDAVLEYGFTHWLLDSVYIHCDPNNRPALYCSFHLGFTDPKPSKYLDSTACRLHMDTERFTLWRKQDARTRKLAALSASRAFNPVAKEFTEESVTAATVSAL